MRYSLRGFSRTFVVIVALFLLTSVDFLPSSAASAAETAPAPESGACHISKDEPLKIPLREDRIVTVTCTDGKLTVRTRKNPDGNERSGRGGRIRITAVGEPDEFEADVPGHDPGAPPSSGEISGNAVDRATCNVRSTLWDNSGLDIEMTRYTLYLAWVWNDDTNRIRALGRAWAGWKYEQKTGWYTTGGSVFLYRKTVNGQGKWIKQGMEGWRTFNGAGDRYPHEHRTILFVTRDGACTGENQFYGTVPNFSYQEFRIYKTGFTRAR